MRLTTSCIAFLLFFMQGSPTILAQSANPIVTENLNPGVPIATWGVPDFRDSRINGFATEISVNKGTTVSFKVHSQSSANFTMDIYRLGYYGGNGARQVANLGTVTGKAQATGITDAATGLYDCRNWTVSKTWAVPVTAVSGVYIAKITRTGGGSNHILFVVRDDAAASDMIMTTTDATWQAYNGYGGNFFYNGTTAGYTNGRAVKVSYNRPFFPYNAGFQTNNMQSDWYMNAEYSMIRFLERNGYNVSYLTNVDMVRTPSLLLSHKIFITAGHDEYWSAEMRTATEAARNAGVHCVFLTGNEVYWKTRWENDGAGNPYRTLVCYKEGTMGNGSVDESSCGTKCDPLAAVWTGQWRSGGAYDAGKPENALTGQISWAATNNAIEIPFEYKNHRFWRNTSVASLAAGQKVTASAFGLGYEMDFEQYEAKYPEGRMKLSSTTVDSRTHHLSLYRHSSGALVFGAGSVQFVWNLDDAHLGGAGSTVSTDLQQAMINLFADMTVQPGSLMPGMVAATASADLTAPTAAFSFPAHAAQLVKGVPVVITGTATDNAFVSVVELSFDGGITWTPATGTTNWSYTWKPAAAGTVTIKVRAWDDSGNKGTAGSTPASNAISVTVNTTALTICPCTVFTDAQAIQAPTTNAFTDYAAIVLGMRFRPTENGYITGVRFYKALNNNGVHTGMLYSNSGNLLAQATFATETASGWQTVSFNTPVFVKKDTTYVVAYHSASGFYSASLYYFTASVNQPPLIGLGDGVDGANGIYKYSNTPAFPDITTNQSNYWVDVVFSTALNTWVGTSSNSWEDPLNWSAGYVPSTQSSVVIPSGTPFSPVTHSNITVKSLHMNAAASLTVSTGYSFRVELP